MNKIEELKKEYDRWFIRYQMYKYIKWVMNEWYEAADRDSRSYSNFIYNKNYHCSKGFEKVEKKFLEVKAAYEAALKEVA
jgi:hypothetical protein